MSVVNGKRQSAWFGVEPDDDPGARSRGDGIHGPFVGVVFNRPLDQVFTYRVPSRLAEIVRPGQRVNVPLGRGNKPAVGYVVRVDENPPEGVEPWRIKEVIEILDVPPLIDATMLELTRWMAGYYACAWGQALDAVVPAGVKKQAGTRVGTYLVVPEEVRARVDVLMAELPPKQAEVLATLLGTDEPLTIADVGRMAKCGPGTIGTLRQRGLLHTIKRRARKRPATPDPAAETSDTAVRHRPALTAEQEHVLKALTPALSARAFATFLIHGVTGSGKTEVYLSAIEHVVAAGREAIVLVPEISLTPQTIRRFQRRFAKVAVLHSHLSDAERHRHWRSIASGEAQVIVGARSAVFAPARRLGLIVIDEEHESTFKQETTPRYHARDVAVKRGQLEGVPVLLGSATPALESWRNAEIGRYTRLTLRERVGSRPMPEVQLIDLRHEKPPLAGLSEPLRQAMILTLADKGQVILLLNRRGFHTFVICPNPSCGQVLKCDACDVALTYHKQRRLLICHTCDAERPRPPACPNCRATNLHYGGIGTERLEREVALAFPDHRIRRMDSDTMRTPGSHEAVLSAFKAGEVDVLLGTQMIAKGLDFPNVTLVGVVNADTALHMPDFRAAERTFQLVAQVAGRTGRGDRPGRVLVQTCSPDVPAIALATHHDYEGFVATELPERQRLGMPPFGRLVRVIARGPDEPVVRDTMEGVAAAFREAAPPGVRVVGPAPAPVVKIRNLYRYHLRLIAPTPRPLQDLVKAAGTAVPLPHGVELAIDVDPIGML
ncbi:MAG: primosomal protein N' [Isosphaeraceae bacterium]